MAEVLLSPGEDSVGLHGYCHQQPKVTVRHGTAEPVSYDAATGHFRVLVHPDASAAPDQATDPVRHVEVAFGHGAP